MEGCGGPVCTALRWTDVLGAAAAVVVVVMFVPHALTNP